jgi:hypothetical protein
MARTATFRFSFYVRDWLSGTRQLTFEERGLYIDLLAMIYERGGRFRMPSEPDFCRMLASDPRVVRRVLGRLIILGKIEVKDGVISNARAADQIGLAGDEVGDTYPQSPEDVPRSSQGSPPKVGTGTERPQGVGSSLSKSLSEVLVIKETPAAASLSEPARAAVPPLGRSEDERPEATPAEALARGWGAIRREVWPEAGALGWCVSADDVAVAAGLVEQGLDAAFCLAVIRAKCDALKAGGHGARNRLSWFRDAIADARATASRPLPSGTAGGGAQGGGRVVAMIPPDDLWRPRLLGYQRNPQTWLALWGRSPWHSAGRALALEILGPMPPELADETPRAPASAADEFEEIPEFLRREGGA